MEIFETVKYFFLGRSRSPSTSSSVSTGPPPPRFRDKDPAWLYMPDNKGWEEGAIASYSLAIEGRGHTYAFRLKGSKKNYSDARGKRFGEDELRKEKPETWEEGDGIEGAYSQELKEKSEDNEASTEQA